MGMELKGTMLIEKAWLRFSGSWIVDCGLRMLGFG